MSSILLCAFFSLAACVALSLFRDDDRPATKKRPSENGYSDDRISLSPRKGVCMLVITRKNGQSVIVGDAVITVTQRGKQTSVRIKAPANVLILRSELVTAQQQVEQQQQQAVAN